MGIYYEEVKMVLDSYDNKVKCGTMMKFISSSQLVSYVIKKIGLNTRPERRKAVMKMITKYGHEKRKCFYG
ncbi:MAG: hypothetical protein ACRDDY_02635 [Clostridium sp.]|uniref:hypothetical protein n=1 Tax=Clostridium sp. TaxID=1506 RepID=UPI003EE434EA